MERVGVFVCHCGSNISGTVDVEKVAKEAGVWPEVAYATDYKFMCSEPGQDVIKKAIKEHNLTRVVVSACTPRMHEKTFRKAAGEAGLNPYLVQMANIREQCSWVHKDMSKGTPKATTLTRAAVGKAALSSELFSSKMPVTKRALVIGGGIAGIQAALDIAASGYEAVIVEREPTIGGRMAQIDKTFPTLDCSSCILTPKMVDAASNPLIKLYTYSEVEKVDGFVGNFKVKIRKKARSVVESECTGCGNCWEKCPVKKIPGEFDAGLGTRTAISVPFPQAVPNIPVIDRENCTYFKSGKCGVCAKVCPKGCIDYNQQDQIVEEEFGSIIVATGFDLFDESKYGEYGHGKYPDVVNGLQFERLISATGPTGGKIKRPSDGKVPESIVFVKCVGSRDEAKGNAYCSKACCMYVAKHATLFMDKVEDAQATIFYMDVRTGGKNYEEFYRRTQNDYKANYVRGRVAKIFQEGDQLVVWGEDTLLGRPVEVHCDMVVLATAIESRHDAAAVAQNIGFSYDKSGFFTEAHAKLAPVESNKPGVFLAGVCQGPKDIPETVAQASAAAVKAVSLFSRESIESDPVVSDVDNKKCIGCLRCHDVCPYGALGSQEIKERTHAGEIARPVCTVNESVCAGCGACTVACNSGAINLRGFTNQQILMEVEAICL